MIVAAMPGAADITDDQVARSAEGSSEDTDRVLRAMEPQVRLMVAARLSANRAQHHALDEIAHLAMVGLSEGIGRLENRTVNGLKAFASVIVGRRVSDYLRRRGGAKNRGAAAASLDSTVSGLSGGLPLGQLLSAGGKTPSSAAAQADETAAVLEGLAALKPEYREVITLAIFDQLPTRDIAERMNISRPAASMLLIRAIKTLRRNLTGSSKLEGQDGRDN